MRASIFMSGLTNKLAVICTRIYATIALLKPLKGLVHTITADNGKAFAYHEKISVALETEFYFAPSSLILANNFLPVI